MAPELLSHLVIGIRALAAREEAFLAEKAFSARDREWNHHPITDLELLICRTDLENFAHGFMAENVALLHRGHDAVEKMEVRSADRAGGDLDDGVASVLDLGIRHALAADIVLAVPR